jgi:hypothetical protein
VSFELSDRQEAIARRVGAEEQLTALRAQTDELRTKLIEAKGKADLVKRANDEMIPDLEGNKVCLSISRSRCR